MESAITAKGQATIPKLVRQRLNLRPGDRVKFFMHPDGTVVLLPKLPASALRGFISPPEKPISIEDMTKAVVAGATDVKRRKRRR